MNANAIDDLLDQAMLAHEQGHLDQARMGYQAVLKLDAQQFDALHMLGVLAMQAGEFQQAADLIAQAIQVHADMPEAHMNLGVSLMELKQPDQAVASFDQAMALMPGNVQAQFFKGLALLELKRFTEAAQCFDLFLKAQPQHAQAWLHRGQAYSALGLYQEALSSLNQALALQPDNARAHATRGDVLRALDRFEDAVAAYDQALAVAPDLFDAWTHRGNALLSLKRVDEAIQSHHRALALAPGHASVLTNLAGALREAGRWQEALAHCEQAIEAEPTLAGAHMNRGSALLDMGQVAQARQAFAQVVSLQPDHVEANWGQGWCDLLTGQWAQGLPQLEWRWKKPGFASPEPFTQPLWLGQGDVQGRTILLHAEQGLGDTIHFARYAKVLADQGARVLLQVQPALKGLMATLDDGVRVLGQTEPLPAFDLQCPLMSLPLACRTTPDQVPMPQAYLRADPKRVQAWGEQLGPKTQPRVGLVWSGNAAHRHDAYRSMPLQALLDALPQGVQYYCLQKDVRERDQAALHGSSRVVYLPQALQSFDDSAALIAHMDVVISVDTSVAHLAGALGKPTWILLAQTPDWRWLLDRSDSPWYACARLFRQTALGRWQEPLQAVAQALRAEVIGAA